MNKYVKIIKPGIIAGNLLTGQAGFILASTGHVDIGLLCMTLLGLALVIAGACALNQYTDKAIDAKMARTKTRPLVTGTLSDKQACIIGVLCMILGSAVLLFSTNVLTTCIAGAAFLMYVVLYGMLKPRTRHATLVGSIAGALPPVIGYTAIANTIDIECILLFLSIMFWQMPHFFAIAMYRLADYKAASIPVLPLSKGIYATKVQSLMYIIAFTVVTCMLTLLGYTSMTFVAATICLGSVWLWLALQGFGTENNQAWARSMFRFSLVVVVGICTLLPFASSTQ